MTITNHIAHSLLLLLLLAAPTAWAQNKNKTQTQDERQTVIKLNKLDVVYPDEEYSGLVVSPKETPQEKEQSLSQRPFLMDPPPPLTTAADEPAERNIFQSPDDDGAESEDEILYASFDPNVIHYPKIDLNKWKSTDTVVLHLVNHRLKHEFAYPTPSLSRATSHFGARGRRRWHYGVDLAMPTGEPIYAAFDGVVRVSVLNKSYGNLIVIRHTNGLETYYAHMSKRYAQVGDTVRAGQTIGLCGNTGRSYGSHLHFEVRYMGAALNPENVIDCSTQTLREETLRLTPRSFAKVGSSSGRAVASSSKGNSSTQRSGTQYYKVKQGDTLSRIAARHHTTVKRLCQLNGIKETTILRVGRNLRVR